MYQHLMVILRPRPMVVVSLVFMVGICLELWADIPTQHLVILVLSAVLVLIAFKGSSQILVLLLLLLLCGMLRYAVRNDHPMSSLKYFNPVPDSLYQIEGLVTKVGETRRGNQKLILQPLRIGSSAISKGHIILYAGRDSVDTRIADTLIALARLANPRLKPNPYAFDYRQYLESQDIYLEAYLKSGGVMSVNQRSGRSYRMIMAGLRHAALAHLQLYLSPHASGVLAALTLGERSEVDQQTREDFANTGVIHVLAVSGLHVGYVSLILMSVVGILRIPKTMQLILVILGLGFYVLLTGSAPSVMRAAIMASLVLISIIIERNTDIYNVLATAAFLILLIDPNQLFSIGFQLSFSAVLSIVSLFPLLKDRVPIIDFNRIPAAGKLLNSVVDLFLVSLAAQLGTLAFTVLYFQKIPLISLLANLIVVPVIGLIVATGLAFLTLGSFVPLFASWWSALLDAMITLMLAFVSICANVSWAYIPTRSIYVVETMLILLITYSILLKQWRRISKAILVLTLIWANLLIWQRNTNIPKLEVVMLDVGQGDAIVVHTPGGETIVVDAGLRFGGRDMGKDVISPYLRSSGPAEIDLLVLTHPHNDHIGGAQYLAENHRVKRVLIQDVAYDSYTYETLRSLLDSLEIPRSSAYAGEIDSTLAPLYIRILGPAYMDSSTAPSNVNDVSIVMQLLYGETSLLLTGDAEIPVERDMVNYGALLESDILKVPHHGSKTSSSKAFIDLVRPEYGLISLANRNKYEHPDPETLAKYEELNTHIHRTDLEGAIIYRSDGKTWEHYDWRADGL